MLSFKLYQWTTIKLPNGNILDNEELTNWNEYITFSRHNICGSISSDYSWHNDFSKKNPKKFCRN